MRLGCRNRSAKAPQISDGLFQWRTSAARVGYGGTQAGGKRFLGAVPGKNWRRSHCPASNGQITCATISVLK
jgi:hypothetical protein